MRRASRQAAGIICSVGISKKLGQQVNQRRTGVLPNSQQKNAFGGLGVEMSVSA
jgi:hypothetical protein